MSNLTLSLVQPTDRIQAIRLATTPTSLSATERDRQTASFIRYAEVMGWSLDWVWAIQRGGKIVWSCAAIPSPGRSAMLLTPPSPSIDNVDLIEALKSIAGFLHDQDLHVVQLLSRQEDTAVIQCAIHAGFERIANLRYLTANVRDAQYSLVMSRPENRTWTPYSEAQHTRFRDLIALTYQNSLDCTALTGRRHLDDVIAGHKSAGEFNPDHWLLIEGANGPEACILLSRLPQRSTMELVYIGVAPDVRGRGLGRALISKALEIAENADCDDMTLAVDATNVPALRLYESAGFTKRNERVALIHFSSST